MRIDHINITAPWELLQQLRDFYCGALELMDGPRPDFGIRGFWLYAEGAPIIHLFEKDIDAPTERPLYLDHVAYELEDLDAYVRRLEAMGVEYVLNHIPDFHISQVFCKDPCGNGVEVNFRIASQAD